MAQERHKKKTPGESIAITNVRIFDGENRIPNRTVVITGRTIAYVGKHARIPYGAEVIDGSGQTLMPGLIDGHAHDWGWGVERALIFHELAHCVSMRVNPAIPNNPRWLWESVALFEAGQIGDARRLGFVASGRPPTFTELNTIQNTTIYEVGGLIGQFIVETWGRETLLAMVRANGNLLLVPGLTEADFLSRWMEWRQLGALTNTSRAAL